MTRAAEKVRPFPGGGWYCEVGTARPPTCANKATWIMKGYDPANPMPGTVHCDEHHKNLKRLHPLPPEYVPLETP